MLVGNKQLRLHNTLATKNKNVKGEAMKQMKPEQLITGLGEFVTTNREEELGPHQSLYVEIWNQWKAMNEYPMSWADERSQKLARKYWQGMNHWYKLFAKSQDEIMKLDLAPTFAAASFYVQLTNQYAADIKKQLPPVEMSQRVVKINDFSFGLRQQLEEFGKLQISYFTMIDYQLLIEYWHELAGLVGVDLKEEGAS